MDSIRQYILSVICMVIVCGVLQLIFQEGANASLIKLISGLIVTITVLSPLLKDKILQWDLTIENIATDGGLAVEEGERVAENALTGLIKEKTQTYILTKASEMGTDVTVDVEVQEMYPNTPKAVTIKGKVSPYVKQQLANCMRQDLGIAEEDQIWISQN